MPRILNLEKWQEKVRGGQKFQTKYGNSKAWNRYYKMYRGDFKKGVIPANLLFPLCRSLIPRVYFRDPKVSVTAARSGYELQARVVEAVDNWLIREINLKYQIKLMIQDSFFYGTGPGIHGFDSEWGFKASDQLAKSYYKEMGIEVPEKEVHQDVKIKNGMPWFLRVQPDDFIVPWGTVDIDSAPWCAYRVYRALDEVKKDPIYENKKDLSATYSQKVDPDRQSGREDDAPASSALGVEEQEYVELWTIHDAREKKIMVMAPNHDKWLRHENDDLQIEGLPVQVLQFNPDGRQFWAVPDAKIILPQQLELNEIRTQQMKHRRLCTLKILYDKSKITKDELNKLLSENVGPGVAVTGSPGDSVVLVTPTMPQSLSQDAVEVRGDVREMVGFSREATGQFAGPPRKTKYEVQAVREAHMIRIDERRDMVADLLTSIIRKINQQIFSWWTTEQVIPVVGEDLAMHWVSYTGPEIRGEYSYKIDPESGTPVTEDTRRADAREMFDMFKDDQLINPVELRKHVLSQFRGVDVNKFLPPQQQMGTPGGQEATPMGQIMGRGRIAPLAALPPPPQVSQAPKGGGGASV